MTGARVGWLVTPPGWRPTMLRVQEALVSCVDAPAQRAALAAMTGESGCRRAAARHYRENLAAAMAELDRRGLRYLTADRRVLPVDRRVARIGR